MTESLAVAELLAGYPQPRRVDITRLRNRLATQQRVVVVIDDDPTGTQTVAGVPVIARATPRSIDEEMDRDGHVFFVLTNSRSLPAAEAVRVNRDLGRWLSEASARTERPMTVVSRSDSTLRGHFPSEVDAVIRGLGYADPLIVLMPYFGEGGRWTVGGTHYVVDGDHAVPASQTPFASDATFGFRSSRLTQWIVEKSGGAIAEDSIGRWDLADLREMQLDLSSLIERSRNKAVMVMDAADPGDAAIGASLIAAVEDSGRRVVARSAAGVVPPLAGLPTAEPSEPNDLVVDSAAAGLIVIGSHVPKSTEQFRRLRNRHEALNVLMLRIDQVLDADWVRHRDEIVAKIESLLGAAKDVALVTQRELALGRDGDDSLNLSRRVSAAVVDIVANLRSGLRFLIAKGGITSSDIATEALGVRRAMVIGPAIAGVPAWRLGPESRRPGLPYIVFPGNVGDADALADLYERLRRTDR